MSVTLDSRDLYDDYDLHAEAKAAAYCDKAGCYAKSSAVELQACACCNYAFCAEHHITVNQQVWCQHCLEQSARAELQGLLDQFKDAPVAFAACRGYIQQALQAVPRG